MLRFWFIDAAIVARFKPKGCGGFSHAVQRLQISARRGAQHRMTEAAILRPKVVGWIAC
jgi:hypothetical protein